MIVLSLFDGISCGQVALERAGIEVELYLSSEIDKYAIQITQKNYPNTIQLGDIRNINGKDFEGEIDLLMGGSPCQGFSFAGKQLNFEDPRSALFFEFVRILEECKPKWFLLENVVMKKEYQDIISSFLGVELILINSSLVSAQNRKRLYWTNINNVLQPEDKKILLKDILEDGSVDRNKSLVLTRSYYSQDPINDYFTKKRKQIVFTDKKYKTKAGIYKFGNFTGYQNDDLLGIEGKSKTVTAQGGNNGGNAGGLYFDNIGWRKLTPIECERLQTLPDNYTEGISNTQRYKCIGNGWTVDVIAYILKGIKT